MIALVFVVTIAVVAALDYRVDVSKSGSFQIRLKNKLWFESGPYSIRLKGREYSTLDKSLSLVSITSGEHGCDNLGEFRQTSMGFSAGQSRVSFNILEYDDFVVFEQAFDDSFDGTSTGNSDGVISSFPSFEIREQHEPSAYAQWVSWYYTNSNSAQVKPSTNHRYTLVAPGFKTPLFGQWDENTSLYGGIGGSGVTCVFNSDMSTSVVISPLTNFMSASQVSAKGGISYGIMGNVTSVPKGFSLKYMMQFSEGGLNEAMYNWGGNMRKFHNKLDARAARERDITLQYIGFSTDNGAYYYYNTVPGLNYEDTLIQMKKYSDSINLPYRYVLLDSWWYYKGENGGIANWTARPDVFPSGMEGLYAQTGWLVQAHNRYWAEDAVYARQNGGQYDFLIDSNKHGSVPTDDKFWDDLFSHPTSAWGLRVYEQDWLHNEFNEYVGAMLETVDLGKTWLNQMGKGAERNSLTIQYCMPFVRHMLHSLEVSAVTQVRASDDYVVSPYDGVDNWRIGGQNILIDALGLAPSKDGFWSSSYQPGNPYGEERFEPYPRMQAAVAAITSGPVQIADGIGYTDSKLVSRMIMSDGRLLQPGVPAKRIDANLLREATGRAGPDGDLWAAYSMVSNAPYLNIFAASVTDKYAMKLSDVFVPMHRLESMRFWASEANSTSALLKVTSEQPLWITPCGVSDFQLYSLVPVLPSGWALQGEVDKFVPVSPARFHSVRTASSYLSTVVKVAAKETVTVGIIDPLGKRIVVTCNADKDGFMTISSDGSCTQGI